MTRRTQWATTSPSDAPHPQAQAANQVITATVPVIAGVANTAANMGITARTPIYAVSPLQIVSAEKDRDQYDGHDESQQHGSASTRHPLRHAPPRPSSNNSPVESTARALLIRAATVVGCGKSQTRPGEPSITSTSSAVMAGGSVLPVQAGCSSRNSSIMAQVVAGAERPVNTPRCPPGAVSSRTSGEFGSSSPT